MIPLPNSSSGCNSTVGSCYDFAFAQPTYWREELFRIDHDIQPGKLRANVPLHPRLLGHHRSSSDLGLRAQQLPDRARPLVWAGHKFSGSPDANHLEHAAQRSGRQLHGIAHQHGFASGCECKYRAPAELDGLQGYLFNNGFGGKYSGITLAPGNLAYGGGFSVDPGYAPWQLANPTWSAAR